jgi:hypothetical protein
MEGNSVTDKPQTTEEKIKALLERAYQRAGLPVPPPDAPPPPKAHTEPEREPGEEG